VRHEHTVGTAQQIEKSGRTGQPSGTHQDFPDRRQDAVRNESVCDRWPQSAQVSNLLTVPKRLLVGRPLRSERLGDTLLPKKLALPVFCSDPLSSNS